MAGGFTGLLGLTGIWFNGAPPSGFTRQERFSMMNFWDGTHVIMTQEVNSTVGATDRATLLDLYCGIALSDPTPVVGVTKYIPVLRRRRR